MIKPFCSFSFTRYDYKRSVVWTRALQFLLLQDFNSRYLFVNVHCSWPQMDRIRIQWRSELGGEERRQLCLCGQSYRKVTLFPPTMNDEAQKQWTFQANVTIYTWTTWHQKLIVLNYSSSEKFVESFHIKLNMTSIANETEPCLAMNLYKEKSSEGRGRSSVAARHRVSPTADCVWIMSWEMLRIKVYR